jgi:hypothetical protein
MRDYNCNGCLKCNYHLWWRSSSEQIHFSSTSLVLVSNITWIDIFIKYTTWRNHDKCFGTVTEMVHNEFVGALQVHETHTLRPGLISFLEKWISFQQMNHQLLNEWKPRTLKKLRMTMRVFKIEKFSCILYSYSFHFPGVLKDIKSEYML